ncbi:MAG: sodium:proton exchanger [Actinomycetota bacterium]|nr:sodium:proton exchanger [Actinomycetota bacterium]
MNTPGIGDQPPGTTASGRHRVIIAVTAAVMLPGVVLRLFPANFPDPLQALIFGLAIVGAAFLLSWAAEVAQLDISAGLAIAVLALIAVLPEYAVDMVFSIKAGQAVNQFGSACQAPGATGETPCSLALANMTGANRLLIGFGWSMVVFVGWYRFRKQGDSFRELILERSHSVELAFLTIASLYCLTLPFKRTITLVDAALLVGLFVLYTVRISKAPASHPDLVGAAAYIGAFPKARRRATVIAMFVVAATVIILCAERFAESLVSTGADLGISEFFLVQWLAPLASEAPELLVAGLYAWRLNTNAGLATLVSSKVNQWTLLVGSLPVVFAISSGSFSGLPILARQREELLLTAAQSVFAVVVLSNLSISVREAWALFGLFWAQFFLGAVLPASAHGTELVAVSVVYLVLAAYTLFRLGTHRGLELMRDGLVAPYSQLVADQ